MAPNRIESELRGRARELIGEGKLGKLPRGAPVRTWAGYGTGLECSLCAEPIPRKQVEYELECRSGHVVHHFRFHIGCLTAWQVECEGAVRNSGAGQGS